MRKVGRMNAIIVAITITIDTPIAHATGLIMMAVKTNAESAKGNVNEKKSAGLKKKWKSDMPEKRNITDAWKKKLIIKSSTQNNHRSHPMLKLIETVEWEVECGKCGGTGTIDQMDLPSAYEPNGIACPDCNEAGHRTVVYQVEAEVDFEERMHEGIFLFLKGNPDYYVLTDGEEFGCEGLAKALLAAHLAGEDLPGVKITEVPSDD